MTVIIKSNITNLVVDFYEGCETACYAFIKHMKKKYRPKEIRIIQI